MSCSKRISFLHLIFAIAINASAANAAQNSDNQSIYDALVNEKSLSQLRLKYEYVDQQSKSRDANTFTLKTLSSWQTANYSPTNLIVCNHRHRSAGACSQTDKG